MKNIVDYSIIVLVFILSLIFFFVFDLEGILLSRYDKEVISKNDIENNKAKDYTGLYAGDDITLVKNATEWDDVLNDIDYITIIPKSIVKTNVYSLAKWESYYETKRNGSSGRRLAEVKNTTLDISSKYIPYYIIELDDSSHILAQMNRSTARKIEKGESIRLPLGKKIGFSQKTKDMLKPICDEYNVSTKYVFYSIDNNWQKENKDKIMFGKFGISFAIFIVMSVVLQLIVNRLFFKDCK